jgi:hypothetical protein
MFKTEVVRFFNTQASVAEFLGVSQASISKWRYIIPEKQALRIDKLTNGALEYDATLYAK